MSTVFGQYKRRQRLKCTNVWILCLTTSLIPHRWMTMVHQSDQSVTIFKLQSALGKLIMLSQGKHFYIPLNLPTFSKLFLIAAVPQQFGPILKDEYGRALDFEYIRVNNEYTSLHTDPNTTMDTHITRFNQLLQEIEYNKPITIPSLQPESVNLQFMLSIGEGWETFSLAKGDWIRQVSTAELHSEI